MTNEVNSTASSSHTSSTSSIHLPSSYEDHVRKDSSCETSSSPTSPPQVSSDSVTFVSLSHSTLASAHSLPGTLTHSSTEIIISNTSPKGSPFQHALRDSPIDIHKLPFTVLSPPLTTGATSGTTGILRANLNDGFDFSTNRAISFQGSSDAPPGSSQHPIQTLDVSSPPLPTLSTSTSPSPTATPSSQDDSFRTPNVYINGLPPNCAEDELREVASRYGDVVSVRTFTRHVSDKPSGYGFVLFHTVESAERCIEALRKERHLHPSFSKRVHKIPGTQYATVSPDAQLHNALSTAKASDPEPDGFKANMERLKDPNSTNLYMEGLPLSINEEILAALVSPYKIMSSRLFQTRLSNPPRMIAFVRLETRSAAEEVVERLHGRMVRGWNDPGCRISVRFADTSEQRELRRNERFNREGDHSPSRLTVAHASLLNMNGTQGRHLTPPLSGANLGSSPTLNGNLSLQYGHLPHRTFVSPPPPVIGTQHFDDSLQKYCAGTPGLFQTGFNDLSSQNPSMTYGTSSLANSAQYHSFSPNLGIPHDLHTAKDDITTLRGRLGVPQRTSSAVRASNGYTLHEQNLILQAQLRSQSDALPKLPNITDIPRQSIRAVRNTSILTPEDAPRNPRPTFRLADFESTISEADFHAGAANYSGQVSSPSIDFGGIGSAGDMRTSSIEASGKNSTSPRFTLDHINARLSFNRQRNQTDNSRARSQSGIQTQSHMRSTTLPTRSLQPARDDTVGGPHHAEDAETCPGIQVRAEVALMMERLDNEVAGSGTSGPSERSPVVCPSLGSSVDASQPNSLTYTHTQSTESRSLNTSIHSHLRKSPGISLMQGTDTSISDTRGAQRVPNEAGESTSSTPSAQLSVPPSNACVIPVPNTIDSTGPSHLGSPPTPSISPTLTSSTHTPATMSPSTPSEPFPEPYNVSSTVVSSRGEVGLGMRVNIGPTINLQITGEQEKGPGDAAPEVGNAAANLT